MKNFYRVIGVLVVVSLLRAGIACAQTGGISYSLTNKKIGEYEKAEWDIKLSVPFTNPYDQREISLDMVLTSPSGKPLVLPCYFDKGDSNSSAWKARFSAQETGVYSYYFVLNTKGKITESAKGKFNVLPSGKPGFLHKNNLWTFKFDNGQLFRGIGENVGWESRSFEKAKFTYDHLLPTLSQNGANFFRTWMCYWNLPLEWKKVHATKRYNSTNEYFNPGAIKRMDELVSMTDSLGLYFMLTLDWHGHLMEEGGWKDSPYNQVNGGPAKTPTEFFSLTSAKQKYKNKLRYVIARWGYSTNIAAIEFFNEVDNAAFTKEDSILIPHHLITQWHDDMGRYLKGMDPYNHLVTTSVSHRDIAGMNSLAYLDFNQKHIYKHTEKIPAIYPDYIENYRKPYVVGEFGFRWEDDDPKYAKEANFDFKRGLWYGMFSPTPILPMSWWWELFDDQKMAPYFKGVRQVSDMMLIAGNGKFVPVDVAAGRLHAQAVQCGKQYFVYLLNTTGEDLTQEVSIAYANRAKPVIKIFYPSTLKITQTAQFKLVNGQLNITDIKLNAGQEVVLIISPD
ncbi:DUF5060 domain-containing protein [Mucilaginibacter terrigena]|uniref:DUF5060 domain-containing protein n=1 Tax=Mucilaginibacter terrigena TaxID=2492395 RepID=A0A4Q5LMI3_9SPHI|nr:DUF5060 domain-containing protein [Mucilaginibacter terrigena]RYU90898.1 DUF5060 domain-containing protein [Mucilaginibacter terrigena]